MRSREAILLDILNLIRDDRTTAENHATVAGLSLEILCDLRDQNERIIALLSQDHSHEVRMNTLNAITEVMKRARRVDEPQATDR